MIWWIAGAILTILLGWWLLRRSLTPPTFDFQSHLVKSGDVEFHFVVEGNGPEVLLLHGIGANLLCWRRLWPLLQEKYRVLALDLPGFGRSSKGLLGFGLDEQIERIKLFLDRMSIQKVHLVGNSMGANIALWFALHHPERVRTVTVIAPATSRRLVPLPLHWFAWLALPIAWLMNRHAVAWAHGRTVVKKELVDATRVQETLFTYARNYSAIRSFLLATQAIRDARLAHELANIDKKILILHGENDALVPITVIRDLEKILKKSCVKLHPTGGHHLQEDEPEWVAQELESFFGP